MAKIPRTKRKVRRSRTVKEQLLGSIKHYKHIDKLKNKLLDKILYYNFGLCFNKNKLAKHPDKYIQEIDSLIKKKFNQLKDLQK